MAPSDARPASTVDFESQAQGGDIGHLPVLDEALWKQLGEGSEPPVFARAWLHLLCSFIPDAARGVVLLAEAENGPFVPVAYWPAPVPGSGDLAATAELALKERRIIVRRQSDGASQSAPWYAASPVLADGRLIGVAALELAPTRTDRSRAVMRQLRWGVGWLELMMRREQIRHDQALTGRMTAAFDLVAVALERTGFLDAANAVVTDLARRVNCDQVSIGFVRRGSVAVAAISHTAHFSRRMTRVQKIAAAMDEAVDQQAMVLHPSPGDWEYRIDLAHRDLAHDSGGGTVLTIPLHAAGRFFGAMTFERPTGVAFDEAEVVLCDCVASVAGPILEEKRQNDRLVLIKLAGSIGTQLKRLLGPGYFGRKLATTIAAAVVAFFAVFHIDYAITSPSVIEGSVQRTIVAPFDGYVATQDARAGDLVRQDQVLATLDAKDLITERLKWVTRRQEQLTEYGKSLAKGERADAQIDQAQMEQAQAQIELLDKQIERTRIAAPFDGILITGDLSQSVGAAVKRGDQLFMVSPLGSWHVILQVDERDIDDFGPGMTGTLRIAALPLKSLRYTVTRITPIAESDQGANYFRVEATLDEQSLRLRPGMRGIAKTDAGRRLLIDVWTARLRNWIRMTLWKWLP